MNITVYLASSEGKDPTLREAVRAFGTWIGESGNALVYGGSKSGLMGVLAESVIEAGGEATGVEPQFFIDAVLQYEGLTRLIATKDMTERKELMIELGDAFIAFPGDAPCILYNHNGYYEGLKLQLRTAVEQGLASEDQLSRIHFADSVEEIEEILEKA